MSDAILGSLIGMAALTITNGIAIAYGYGKIAQKLQDYCKKTDRLEARQDMHEVRITALENDVCEINTRCIERHERG